MRLSILTLSFAVLACGPSSGGGPGGGGGADPDAGGGADPDARPQTSYPDAAPQERCDKMDILFVVDNSGSMGQEQENLAQNFPEFITVLDQFEASAGTPLDYRVGVTSTGVTKSWTKEPPFSGFPPIEESQDGADGELLLGDGCDMPRRWLERSDSMVSETFSCVAQLGTGGPNKEMPLEASRLALTERLMDTNDGFLREDALLALVIITDENDCSRKGDDFSLAFDEDVCDNPDPVPDYLSSLDGVKGDRGRWAAAVIAGAGPGPCSSELGEAEEAARLLQFADMVGENAEVSSICEGDLASGLQSALETFDDACESFPPIE